MIIIITWQKIIPIILIPIIIIKSREIVIIFILCLASIIAPLSKINKYNRSKTIMALSSLNNNGWLIIGMLCSPKLCLYFLCLYTLSLKVALKTFEKITVKRKIIGIKFWEWILITINLGGLPPLSMFWAKLIIIKIIIRSNLPFEVCLILIASAAYILYHYIWITTSEIIEKPQKNQNKGKSTHSKTLIMVGIPRIVGIVTIIRLGTTQKGIYIDTVKLISLPNIV